jgi:hypothetical protein
MLEDPVIYEAPRSGLNRYRNWSPKVISSVVGLCFLSGASVFLLLYHRDNAAALRPVTTVTARTEDQPRATAVGQGQAVDLHNPAESSAVRVPEHVSLPGRVEFNIKRSRSYQTVGDYGLRLLRVNPRRRICDVSIQLKNRRTLQKRLQVARPLQFKPTPSADSLEIMVSAILKDSIAGSLSASPASVTASNQ